MAREDDRHVVPDGEGGWKVERENAERASSLHDTQRDAIDRAREIVDNAGGGEVSIHGRDGQIRDKRTIGKPDPYPPAG